MLAGLALGAAQASVADILSRLYAAYRRRDAELLEINPLAELADGRVIALDCKFMLDDAGPPTGRRISASSRPPLR